MSLFRDAGYALAALLLQGHIVTMPAMDFEHLGRALRRCRMLQDMTASDLAAKAGLHRNTLSAYEGGKALDDKTFVKLCLLLEVDIGEVFAAACLAKLEFLLRPLEDQLRGEMGLPAREIRGQDKPAADQYDKYLTEHLTAYGNLRRFTFEHFGLQSH